MSTGIVVCSACQREVHQDGPKDARGTTTWTHCEDGTPRCAGATSDYPDSRAAIKGRWCGRDQDPFAGDDGL
jgi:hypothetical protein